MSAIGNILGFLGPIAAAVYPPAAPFIAFAQRIEPFAEAGMPLLQDAIKAGPEAFAAFKLAAPDFTAHLRELAAAIKFGPDSQDVGDVSDHELANLGAHIAGVDPPGWTHEETQRWWDRASANQA